MKARLGETMIRGQRVVYVTLAHDEEADGVTERVGLVGAGLQKRQRGPMQRLVDQTHPAQRCGKRNLTRFIHPAKAMGRPTRRYMCDGTLPRIAIGRVSRCTAGLMPARGL